MDPESIHGHPNRPVGSPPLPAQPKGHLPRLAPGFYHGLSSVHWTLAIEGRATGWLAEPFHHRWQLGLLHTCARYSLVCPAYVLMPDHLHLICLGFCDGSNQRNAIEFLRKHLRPPLLPATWQRQPYDHVFGHEERKREAFIRTVNYVFENPVRAGLVGSFADYPYLGCCVPGYADLEVRMADYWERFWRVYNYLLTAQTTRWRSQPQGIQSRQAAVTTDEIPWPRAPAGGSQCGNQELRFPLPEFHMAFHPYPRAPANGPPDQPAE